MRAVCADFGCELMEFNGENNHVHLLVNFPPKVALSKLVNSLKGVILPAAAPGVSGTGPTLLAGTTPVVRLLLRRFGRGRPAVDREKQITSSSRTGLATRFTPGLKAGALPRGAGS